MCKHLLLETTPDSIPSALTANDRIDKAKAVLGKRFIHAGDFYTPDHLFYELSDDERLVRAAMEILKWIGVKPANLTIIYKDISTPLQYQSREGTHLIHIHPRYRYRPYECGALLVHALMHYILIGKHRVYAADETENENLTNELAIQAGFGLILLNGHKVSEDLETKIKNIRTDPSVRFAKIFDNPGVIADMLLNFIHQYRLRSETFSPHLAPWASRSIVVERGAGTGYPIHIRQTLHAIRMNNGRLLFLSAVLLLGLSTLAALLWPQPAIDQTALSIQQERLRILQERYEKCSAQADDKRRSISPDDILQIKNADAKDTECQEIRRSYNYEYLEYKRLIESD